ncbi:MAG: radical SAM protein [Candidatus Omnitrophica bacterium]|nr:radical SAM protein [Candidatus Omnitrophota bacterium]
MNRHKVFDLNKEINTVGLKKNARLRVALIYPNSYFVGMSNLGVHVIYNLLNSRNDCLCERFFYDPHKKNYFSLENNYPLNSFNVLAFSVSYEMDYLNAIEMLLKSGLLKLREERSALPLILIGGIVNSFNMRPLAKFADAIFIGEAEESLGEFLDALSNYPPIKTQALKNGFLKSTAGIEGVFLPGFGKGENIKPLHIKNINRYPASSKIITPFTEFSNTFLVEISRGCPWNCNFCVTGAVCGTFRPRSLDSLISEIEFGLRYTSRIGLLGAAVSDYPFLDGLLEFLTKKKANISVSSLRVETTGKNLLKALAASRQQMITLAPEAGSDSLRLRLNKHFTNGQFLEKIDDAKKCGIKKIKLYFMIGLPKEAGSDIDAIIMLVKEAGTILPIKVNIGIFVPKPETVFAREEFLNKNVLTSRFKELKRGLNNRKNIQINCVSIREAMLEYKFTYANESIFDRYLK